MLYLDSSAWVRLFLQEANYAAVRAHVAKAQDRICYELGYVEVRAALAAAHRARRIGDAAHEQVKAAFDVEWLKSSVVRTDEVLIQRASGIAEYGALRGYDAMHLAAAERVRLGGFMDMELLSFDKDLVRAAKMLGIRCVELLA
jgi:predicted nucleic acid-binding protein